MKLSRRRLWLVSGLACLAVAGLDTAAWWWATGQIVQSVAAWRAALVAQGTEISAEPAQRTGWPFEAAVLLRNFALGDPGAAVWRGSLARLVIVPWRPTVFTVSVEGPQSLDSAAWSIPIKTRQLEAVFPLQTTGGQMDLDAQAVSLGPPNRMIGVERIGLRLRDKDATLSIQNISLPDLPSGAKPPFGRLVNAIDLQAHVPVPLPSAIDVQGLSMWQKAGGRIELSDVALRWGPLDATGSFTLGLDAGLQPEGTGSVHVNSYDAAIQSLERDGMITRNDARVTLTVLGLLSHAEPGRPASVDLPLRLHSQVLSAGGVPLLRVPHLTVP